MRYKATLTFAALLVTAIAAVACSSAESTPTPEPAASLSITEAWLRPGIDPTAIYLTLTNSGNKAASLNGVEADWAGEISMHETVDDDGFLMMHHMDSVTVPAGGSVVFEPGGMHLMAEHVHSPISEGNSVAVTLLADDGSRIQFTAVARSSDEVAMDHSDHGMADDGYDHEMSGTSHNKDIEKHGAVFASGSIPPGKHFEFTFDHSLMGVEVPYHNHLDGTSGTVMVMEGAQISGETSVTIDQDGYHPQQLTVAPGTTVTWINSTEVTWTVVNGYHPDAEQHASHVDH